MASRRPETAVETSGLTKKFGARLALDCLHLTVARGTIVGYLGPNGAGKTTTIRLLLGLLRPTRGRSTVMGYDTWSQSGRVHAITGYLPGDFVGYPTMTGEDYLAYIASLRGLRQPELVQRLAKRLDADLSCRIGGLSHGNRQKIGILQAMMHEPDVLILDEPTTGLDPLVQREFLQLVQERRESGCTVFLSSHVLSEVEAVADRVSILRAGTLVADLDVAEVRSAATRRIDIVFDTTPAADLVRRVPGVLDVVMSEGMAHVVASGSLAELFRAVGPYGVRNVVTHEPDLEDVFLSYYDNEA
jgi:ABC-2 type transport system ATP-binding protein